MRIGLMVPPQTPLERLMPLARRAEELGYDLLACGEHVFFHVPSTNAFVALAADAGVTSRIRLLSAVTLLPTYPAAVAAKMVATLDGVSGGRFELGVGGEYPAEFRAAGIDPADRGPRADEALEVMTRLFTGAPVTYEGKFARFDGVRLTPPPLQQPGPPLWLGGRRRASLRRAARFADIWMPYMVSPAQLADGLGMIASQTTTAGQRPIRGALLCWSAVDADGRAARRTAVDALGALYQQDFTPLLGSYIPAGTPAEVADRLSEYIDAGARSVLFAPACPLDDIERSAEIFAHEIALALATDPALKETGSRC
jgi:probable F420-dependent oxidoreductase